MNAWTAAAGALPSLLNHTDPLMGPILAAKKTLQNELAQTNGAGGDVKDAFSEFLVAACDGDLVTLESALRLHDEFIGQLYPGQKGATALIFAICFDNYAVAEQLLSIHRADPDQSDTLVNYTPLMWAVHFNQLESVKLLLNYQADPYLAPIEGGKNAVSLVTPENTEIYEYFKLHNLFKAAEVGDDDIYAATPFEPQDPLTDDLATKLKLLTISGSNYDAEAEEETPVLEEDDENFLCLDLEITQLAEFDYDKLLPEQYIKFTDSDIPSLLNYIFDLRLKQMQYQHETKIPAAIVFQLIRYSHLKVNSKELTVFLFDCFTARLRTVTNTKSGVMNMAIQENNKQSAAGSSADIVWLSYWLSVIQFLHFYLSKNDIYAHYPNFLQELINIMHLLTASMSFSINSRLNLLVDDCLLNFTNLVDVSNVLYAKDWNLFKNKKKHPSTYEDIFNMLYPPTQFELMKPSPIRYIQVLGALDYVLKIHKVDKLLRAQAFSQVFYCGNSAIFNRIMNQSKYCSRAKAIQIRLNLSTIEDWLRSHNFQATTLESQGNLQQLLHGTDFQLQNLLSEEPNEHEKRDPHYLKFYYNSLYHIGKNQFQSSIELLQWLQCMSLLHDEESFINTINLFDCLNYYQLSKVTNKLYKYEVGEPKLPKKLNNLIKGLMNEQGENQVSKLNMHYMTQTNFLSKEFYIYLNPNFVFDIALPNLKELISNYGAGLGGVRVLRSKKYQPSLPISVVDDVDDILTENKNMNFNDTYEYDDKEEEDETNEDNEDEGEIGTVPKPLDFKGDELFKEVQMPNSLAHKNWGDDDIDVNPW